MFTKHNHWAPSPVDPLIMDVYLWLKLNLEGEGGLGLCYKKNHSLPYSSNNSSRAIMLMFQLWGIASIKLKQNGAFGIHKFYNHKLVNLL